MSNSKGLSSLSLFFNTSVLTLTIVCLLWYIFYAIAFYRVAKRENTKNAWLAWVPFLQFYLLGNIVQPHFKYKHTGLIMLLTQILIVAIPMVVKFNLTTLIIYVLVLLIIYIYYQAVFNAFYKIVDPDKSFLYLVLGALFPFLIPIWVLVLSKPKEDNIDEEDDYYRY